MENRNNNPIAEEIIHNNPTGYGLFAGIGDNFNSAAQAICELADDAISNLRANSDDPDLSMTIVVSFENLGDAVEIGVVDGGTGITNLDSALTIACRDGAQTPLNEHGFGLKHALASCDSSPSQQWSIRTRTKKDAAANQYREVTAPYSMGTSEEDQPMKVFFYPFGQGPWTPWQMFTWGLVGFLAGILQNAGVFAEKNRPHFTAKLWDRLCPENTNRVDLLHFVRQLTDHAPLRLCLYGFLSGFLYGWIMNLYFIIGYVSPLTWQTIGAAYLSSFFFDFCHGLCTFLVLWALGDPWVRKLERIKIKFGLTAEERNYVLPPSTFEIARENYE